MTTQIKVPLDINTTAFGEYSPFTILKTVSKNSTRLSPVSDRDKLYLNTELFLKIYYSSFLLFVGTILNTLSIVILSRSSFRRTTTSIYLRYLACVDMFVLYNGLSRHFVSGVWGYNIRNISEGFCKFNQWTTSFGPDTSAWILVAVTTERVISIVWPHKVKVICSKMTAAATLIAVSLVIIASNVPLLIVYGDKEVRVAGTNKTDVSKCVPLEPEYDEFLEGMWYYIDLVKFVILPSSILILFNALIICAVIRSRRHLQMRSTSSAKSRNCVLVFGNGSHKTSGLDLGASGNETKISRHNSRISGLNKEMSLTVTLAVINATFVVCNTPIMLYLLCASSWFLPGHGAAKQLTFTAATMAMYTNNAANFLLYCATGSRFRAEMRHLLKLNSKMNRVYKHDSGQHNSECSHSSLKIDTKENLQVHVVTITGSTETCCSHLSFPNVIEREGDANFKLKTATYI